MKRNSKRLLKRFKFILNFFCYNYGNKTQRKVMAKEYSYGIAPYLEINGNIYVLLNKTSEHSLFNFFKGKIESSETIEECAKREFYEETGVLVESSDFEEYFFQNSKRKDVGIYLVDWTKYQNKQFKFQKKEIWGAYWVELDDIKTSKNQQEIINQIENFFNKGKSCQK